MEECFHRLRRQLTQWFTQSSEKIHRTLRTEKITNGGKDQEGQPQYVIEPYLKLTLLFGKRGIVNARNIYSYVMNPAKANPI